jgi:acetoin utilization protein AcuC
LAREQCISRRAFIRNLGQLSLLLALPRFAHGADVMGAGLYVDAGLARYGFPEGHPFGVDRQAAFLKEAQAQSLLTRASVEGGRPATREEIERFHGSGYVDKVKTAESTGVDFLDGGDTPAFPGVYDASSYVVGTALTGLDHVMSGVFARTLQPIGGLHHAGRGHAAGFCVFNDVGVVIETLRSRYGVRRIAYIDIDVHFGDGVFYAFEADPDVIIVDVHQDPRTLYPGTGFSYETGTGKAAGTKLNYPLAPGSGDREFADIWPQIEAHLEKFTPEFFIFQCGADGLQGDPLAGLTYTQHTHAYAAQQLRTLADRHAKGRLMAFGGGGYSRVNLGRAWSAVLKEFLS